MTASVEDGSPDLTSVEEFAVIIDGDEASRRIRDALAAFPDAISYVRAEVAPTGVKATPPDAPSGQWISCERMLADPEWLAEIVRVTGADLGTDERAVAASLFVQNYAYRVLMVPVACMTLAGVVPDASAQSMSITLAAGRPALVGYDVPAALVQATDAVGDPGDPSTGEALNYLLDRAITHHLLPLVQLTSDHLRVGTRLLWGNVAASAAVAFRTMEGCLGPWVQTLGDRFFDAAPDELQGLGSFLALEHGERRGWYWERKNCCMHDRLPSKIRCSDCSLTPGPERRAAYLRTLRGD